jgi:hypothetical protein
MNRKDLMVNDLNHNSFVNSEVSFKNICFLKDWAYGSAKIPLAFTLEMRDTGTNGFLLPPSQIEPTGQETFIAIKALVAAISDSKKRTQKLKYKNKRKAKQTKSQLN